MQSARGETAARQRDIQLAFFKLAGELVLADGLFARGERGQQLILMVLTRLPNSARSSLGSEAIARSASVISPFLPR